MLLPAVSVLVVAQSSSEIPEGLMNNPVYAATHHPRNTGLVKTNPNIEMQRKINGNDREGITVGCKKIHSEALRKFYSSLYMITAVMGEIQHAFGKRERELHMGDRLETE